MKIKDYEFSELPRDIRRVATVAGLSAVLAACGSSENSNNSSEKRAQPDNNTPTLVSDESDQDKEVLSETTKTNNETDVTESPDEATGPRRGAVSESGLDPDTYEYICDNITGIETGVWGDGTAKEVIFNELVDDAEAKGIDPDDYSKALDFAEYHIVKHGEGEDIPISPDTEVKAGTVIRGELHNCIAD